MIRQHTKLRLPRFDQLIQRHIGIQVVGDLIRSIRGSGRNVLQHNERIAAKDGEEQG